MGNTSLSRRVSSGRAPGPSRVLDDKQLHSNAAGLVHSRELAETPAFGFAVLRAPSKREEKNSRHFSPESGLNN